MNVKKGFTLAEVLITLSIIGVVAALTIPSLVRKYERQEWITKYKATFSIISQAAKMVSVNNGGSLNGAWDMSIGEEGLSDHSADMYNAFLPYLKVTKKVENENLAENKCFSAQQADLAGNPLIIPEIGYCVVLTNGASLMFYAWSGEDLQTYEKRDFGIIEIDLNGIKGPNVLGKDYHMIWVYYPEFNIEMVSPYGGDTYYEEVDEIGCPDNLVAETAGSVLPGSLCGQRILRGDYALKY